MSRVRSSSLVALVLLAFAGACGRDVANPPAPTPAASALPVGVASAKPSNAIPMPDIAQRGDGERVIVVAYLWLRRPTCPPCPVGANCEPCPPPYWQFAEKPHGEMGSDPGAIVLADFAAEPELDLKTAYVIEGVLRSHSGQQVISVERVRRLP